MQTLIIPTFPVSLEELPQLLQSRGVHLNDYARTFLAHPAVAAQPLPETMRIVLCSVEEMGLTQGATLPEILRQARAAGFLPCHPLTGVFLRLTLHQPVSTNSVLTGTHCAPQGSITVLSDPIGPDDDFPKGLYLRHVDGTLWLRGYRCDDVHRWSPEDVFALYQPPCAP